nr:hypothetical protein [Tanacetum cinerariifolium]
MVFHLVNGVRASGVEMICEMDSVRYVILEIHAFMIPIRILSIILPTPTILHTPHMRLTRVIPVETILILFPVIHPPPQETSIEILHDQENEINYVATFLRKFNRYSFSEMPKVLLRDWDRVFKIKDALGNKQYKPEDTQELFRELFNDVQNIHEELADMGDKHLDTIPKKESDEFNKSSVEDLVPNPSEFEDECECDVPDCDDSQMTNFSTFSNPLFDDSTSSDDESSHEEVIHKMSFKTYSNPLFDLDEEIISSKFNPVHNEDLESTPKNDRFDTDSYPLESSLNRDTLMISSLKIDSLLVEFTGELIFLESIPPGVDEANCDPEEDINLVERLLYDNSSPRPPKEFVSKNSDAEIESFSPSPIPNEDSDSRMEEIDLTFTPDDPMPPGIEDDDDDSEELFNNYSLSLPVIESYHFGIPSFSRPPAKPPDGNTGILNIKKMGDISEQKLSSIPGNFKTLAKGFYPPSLNFLSFNWESSIQILSTNVLFLAALDLRDYPSKHRGRCLVLVWGYLRFDCTCSVVTT